MRTLLARDLPAAGDVSVERVSAVISPLARIDWRLFSPPWIHLVFVYDSDRDKWRMRSEDRKRAVGVAKNIMQWYLGLIPFSTEEDLNDGIHNEWRSLLWSLDDDEAQRLWEQIKEIAAELE